MPPLSNIAGPFSPIEESIITKLKLVEDNTDINITSKNESIFNTKKYNLKSKSRIINSKDDIIKCSHKEYKNSTIKEKSTLPSKEIQNFIDKKRRIKNNSGKYKDKINNNDNNNIIYRKIK